MINPNPQQAIYFSFTFGTMIIQTHKKKLHGQIFRRYPSSCVYWLWSHTRHRPFQIIEHKLFKQCETHIEAQSCKASYLKYCPWPKPAIFNKPGVAKVVLQKPLSLIDSLRWWSFRSESSRHCISHTVRSGRLKFLENVKPPPCVTCHVSGVQCHIFCFYYYFLRDKVVEQIWGRSVINRPSFDNT